MPSFVPSTPILDMQGKPLKTGAIVDAATRTAFATERAKIMALPDDMEKPTMVADFEARFEGALPVLTVGETIITSLTTALKDDEGLSAATKLDLYEWAIKVKAAMAGNEPVQFSNTEMGTIKARVNKVYPSPLVVGQVLKAIAGPE